LERPANQLNGVAGSGIANLFRSRVLCFLRFLLFEHETNNKLLNMPLGLSFNFHGVKLVDAISRPILPGANQP